MHPGGLDDEELVQIKRYEDFTTIDWIQDEILERNRRIRTEKSYAPTQPKRKEPLGGLWSKLVLAVIAGQSWLVITLSGVLIGLSAGVISIVTEWLSDLKFGYCSDGWWLNQQFCCWEIEGEEVEGCDSWRPWSTVMVGRWFVFVMFAAVFSFVAAHLVKKMARYAAGSGISEIKCILAGFVMHGFLGFATVVIKGITLPLVIASGLSVGKEGPSVHVACSIGNLISGLFKRFSRSQAKKREIILAASAAGVAVAFGSPVGGVLFSIEEMSHVYNVKDMWRSFLCALVATFTLSLINPFRTGKLVLFQVTYDRDWHFFEIIFFVILGIFGGLYGAFVIKFNIQVAAFRKKYLSNHGVAEAVTLASLTAMVNYFNRFLREDMTKMMAQLFRECEAGGVAEILCQTSSQWRITNSLILATVFRTALVVISYGCKVPAGIFVPSMAIGATFGRMIGMLVKALQKAYPGASIFAVCKPDFPCITPGTYALLGAAAALSGIMRITVTVVIIMFELTGALTYILPTMIVLLVTKAVGDFLGTTGIADEMIRFNGFPYLEKEDHAFGVSVAAVMRTEVTLVTESGMTIADIEDMLASSDVKGFPIVSSREKQGIVGYIGRTELQYVIDRARKTRNIQDDIQCIFAPREQEEVHDRHVSSFGIEEEGAATAFFETAWPDGLRFWPWVNPIPMTTSPELPLEIVMQMFKRLGPRVILVENQGVLVGLVTVKDVLKFMAATESHGPSWDERGGLDGLLDEVLKWVKDLVRRIWSSLRRLVRRRR